MLISTPVRMSQWDQSPMHGKIGIVLHAFFTAGNVLMLVPRMELQCGVLTVATGLRLGMDARVVTAGVTPS